jgi:multidrug efflux system membrane fusion protein
VAELHAPADGKVARVLASEGAVVKQGDLLMALDDAAQREAVLVAQTHVSMAEAALRRSSVEGDEQVAKGQLTLAKVELEAAQRAMDATMIRAPFDGVLDAVDWLPGQEVQKNVVLVRVVKTTDLRLDFWVDAGNSAKVQPGQKFVAMVMGAKEPFYGEVTFVSPQVSNNNVVDVRGKITSGEGLKAGMVCDVVVNPTQ